MIKKLVFLGLAFGVYAFVMQERPVEIRTLPPTTPSFAVAQSGSSVSNAEIDTVRGWHIAFKLIVKEARIAYGQGIRSGLSAYQSRVNALWREPEQWATRNPALKPASLNCDQAATIASEGINALKKGNGDGLVQINAAVEWSERCYLALVRR